MAMELLRLRGLLGAAGAERAIWWRVVHPVAAACRRKRRLMCQQPTARSFIVMMQDRRP
jgi:hypothetical protein